MTTEVTTHTQQRLCTVTINVPQRRNALSHGVLAGLRAALTTADDVAAIVLTGRGELFSAGADLAELSGTAEDLKVDEDIAETVTAIRAAPVPVIAAVEGPCLGAAVDLAMACDLRICGADAWLQVPAVQLGLLYNPGALARMHRSLPRDTFARLVLLAERFTAEEAERAGLVSTVVQHGDALSHAQTLAAGVASSPQQALCETKRFLHALDSGEPDTAYWQRVRERLLDSPERREAVRSARRRTSKGRTSKH